MEFGKNLRPLLYFPFWISPFKTPSLVCYLFIPMLGPHFVFLFGQFFEMKNENIAIMIIFSGFLNIGYFENYVLVHKILCRVQNNIKLTRMRFFYYGVFIKFCKFISQYRWVKLLVFGVLRELLGNVFGEIIYMPYFCNSDGVFLQFFQ